MKASPRQTLSGNVPENLIRVARRGTIPLSDLAPFTVQSARRFPVRNVQAASRISRGEMDGGATVGGPRVG